MDRIMIHVTLGLLILLTLAACGVGTRAGAAASATPTAGDHPRLLTIRAEGGHCVNGGCWSERQINVDGTFTATDSTGASSHGTVDAATIATLNRQIAATDFETLTSRPFTGTCPIAFDGQEYIYTFHTPNGPQTIASCSVEIDANSPLFQTVAGMIEAMNQQ